MSEHHNELAALAVDIRLAHEAARRSALATAEQAMQAGHKLIEAKAMLPHGIWVNWLREYCDLGERTARRYMQVARSDLKTDTVADLGLTAALSQLSHEAEAAGAYATCREALCLAAADGIADPLDRQAFWCSVRDADGPWSLALVLARQAA